MPTCPTRFLTVLFLIGQTGFFKMNMNRNWMLFALFVVLGAGAFLALRQKKQTEMGSLNSWDMEFAVPNVSDIHRIYILDRKNVSADLTRNGDHWLYNGKYKARPSGMEVLLKTIQKVRVWYVPTKTAEPHIVNTLAQHSVKVQLFDKDNKQIKCYYVGGVTNDERGTYMMMDGAERPYVAHLPGFVGQIGIHFMVGDDNWRDRTVFEEKPESIETISVEYPKMKNESFVLEKTGKAAYVIKPFFPTTRPIEAEQRKGAPEAYLLAFEKLVAEAIENREVEIRDSVTQLTPYAIVNLRRTDGSQRTVKFWINQTQETSDGDLHINRLLALDEKNDFYLVQTQVFGPMFRRYSEFFDRQRRPGTLFRY